MPKSQVVARLLDGDVLVCTITSPSGRVLTLTNNVDDLAPLAEGSEVLAKNRALIDNAWAHARFTKLKVQLPSEDEQKAASKRAEAHRDVAE